MYKDFRYYLQESMCIFPTGVTNSLWEWYMLIKNIINLSSILNSFFYFYTVCANFPSELEPRVTVVDGLPPFARVVGDFRFVSGDMRLPLLFATVLIAPFAAKEEVFLFAGDNDDFAESPAKSFPLSSSVNAASFLLKAVEGKNLGFCLSNCEPMVMTTERSSGWPLSLTSKKDNDGRLMSDCCKREREREKEREWKNTEPTKKIIKVSKIKNSSVQHLLWRTPHTK